MNRSFSKIRHIQESNEALERRRLDEANLTRLIKKVVNEQELSFNPTRYESPEDTDARLAAERAKKTEAETSFTSPTLPAKVENCTSNQINQMVKAYSNNNLMHIMIDYKLGRKSFVVFTKDKMFCRVDLTTLKTILA